MLTRSTSWTVGATIKDALCALLPGLLVDISPELTMMPSSRSQTRTGRPRTSTVRTRPLYFEARWLTLPFPRHRPPSFYPRLFRPFHSHAHSDGGLKRFIKDRQAKHQWDDADEADFIKGASSSGSRAVCLALDEGLTVRRGADSSGERVGQGRQVPGEQGASLFSPLPTLTFERLTQTTPASPSRFARPHRSPN